MDDRREVIAKILNMNAEDVCCKKCSAHEGEGLFIDCKFWGSVTKSFEYCSFFLPEGVK